MRPSRTCSGVRRAVQPEAMRAISASSLLGPNSTSWGGGAWRMLSSRRAMLFGPCHAGLSAAIENFFDSVKSRVVDAFSAAGKVGRRERFPDIADGNRKHPEGKCRSGDGDHESAAIATGGERRRRGSTASRMRRGRSRIGSRLARHWKSRGQADSIRTAMPTRHKLP
jgi:hypothetical protein